MPYLRPPLVVRRLFNPIAMRFGIGGSEILTVPGRRTGLPHSVPVVPVDHAGGRYLVSPRGETDWVRNLRAAGRCSLGPHGALRELRATEIRPEDRPPIIAAYRAVAGRAVKSFFDALPDPGDHPVFLVEPL